MEKKTLWKRETKIQSNASFFPNNRSKTERTAPPIQKKKSKNFPAKDHLARELAAELANLET